MAKQLHHAHCSLPVYRLTQRKEFVWMNHNAKKLNKTGFVLLNQKNDQGTLRVGFTASKKVGGAVARARGRRRLKAVFDDVVRLNPQFKSGGLVMVFIVKQSALGLPYDTLKKDLIESLEFLGCTC